MTNPSERTPRKLAAIKHARDLYEDSSCGIEIDDYAATSDNTESGVWVAAWVFVHNEEIEEELSK